MRYLILLLLTGCSSYPQLDNVVRVVEGEIDTSIPYFSPNVMGCSVQSTGNVGYNFKLVYKSDRCNIEVLNEIPEDKKI